MKDLVPILIGNSRSSAILWTENLNVSLIACIGLAVHSTDPLLSFLVVDRDSLGSVEVMKRGDIQMTSTGTGVSHSEYNARSDKEVHFLQIWAKPYVSGLKPNYYGRHFSDEEKTNKILKVVAPPEDNDVVEEREAKGPIPVHANIRVFASILTPSTKVEHASSTENTTKTLIHNIMRSGYREPKDKPIEGGARIKISYENETIELDEGDSVFINGKLEKPLSLESTGQKNAEFLLFEMI